MRIQGVRRPDDYGPDPVGIDLLSFIPQEGGGLGPQGELFLKGPLHTIDERPHQVTARKDGQILFTEPNRSYTLNPAELAQLNKALAEYLARPPQPADKNLRQLVALMQQRVEAAIKNR